MARCRSRRSGRTSQHVKIVWRVRDASGAELGTVGQENDVPRGQLSGTWGDVAFAVATAAGDGLLQVFARAAPPDRSAGAEAAAAARQAAEGRPRAIAGRHDFANRRFRRKSCEDQGNDDDDIVRLIGGCWRVWCCAALAVNPAGAELVSPGGVPLNPANEELLKLPPPERAEKLARSISRWCIGTEAFPMGVVGAGPGRGNAYWSLRCADGTEWAIQIDPEAGLPRSPATSIKFAAPGKECFKKF